MWLLNVDDRRLYQFYGDKIPPYAILSHTWGEEEVTFADVNILHRAEDALWSQYQHTEAKIVEVKKAGGLDKLRKTCSRAKADGYQFAWVDTCCIDKSRVRSCRKP
jgi:hypothetical protein